MRRKVGWWGLVLVLGVSGMALAQTPEELYEKARAAFRARKYAQAVSLLERVLKAVPRHHNAETLLAHSLRRQGRCDRAVAHYQAVLRVYPKRADLWNNLAVCYFRLKKHASAASTFQRVVALEPRNREAYRSWYLACKIGRDYPGALRALDAALKRFPKDAFFVSAKGEILSRMKRHEEAFVWHERAVRLAPKNAEFRYRYGIALRRARRYKEAVEQYRRVVALDSNFAPAYSELGTLLAYMGMKREAVVMYKRYLRFIEKRRPKEAAFVRKRIQELSR